MVVFWHVGDNLLVNFKWEFEYGHLLLVSLIFVLSQQDLQAPRPFTRASFLNHQPATEHMALVCQSACGSETQHNMTSKENAHPLPGLPTAARVCMPRQAGFKFSVKGTSVLSSLAAFNKQAHDKTGVVTRARSSAQAQLPATDGGKEHTPEAPIRKLARILD